MGLFDTNLTTKQTDDMTVCSELQIFINKERKPAPQIQGIDYMFY